MAFKLPELGYDYTALEPYFDAETLEIHHTKHHATYLKKLNEAIKDTSLENLTPTAIFSQISKHNDAIRNNGGGFFNHAMFWQILTPETPNQLEANLYNAIANSFGSLEVLKAVFTDVAIKHFGSGWVWLVKKNDDEIVVSSTPNQDNPLMDIAKTRGTPILCLDIWEHAYYLKYHNKKDEYIKAFWNVVNWDRVAELYNYKDI